MTNKLKITVLWSVFFFGMVSHTLLAMMPIFWGQSIAMSDELIEKNPLNSSLWMTLFFYLIPMIIIVVTIFNEKNWYKITNFVLSILVTIINIWHLIGHAGESTVDSRQIVLLTFVLFFGILLNIVSFKWIKE